MSLIKAIKTWRVILLLSLIVISIIAIRPNPTASGVTINSVVPGSAAAEAGIISPKKNTPAGSLEHLIAIGNTKINTLQDYSTLTDLLEANETVRIVTDKASYLITVKPLYDITLLNETEFVTVQEFDPETNETINKTVEVPKQLREIIGVENIGLRLQPTMTCNKRLYFFFGRPCHFY